MYITYIHVIPFIISLYTSKFPTVQNMGQLHQTSLVRFLRIGAHQFFIGRVIAHGIIEVSQLGKILVALAQWLAMDGLIGSGAGVTLGRGLELLGDGQSH